LTIKRTEVQHSAKFEETTAEVST